MSAAASWATAVGGGVPLRAPERLLPAKETDGASAAVEYPLSVTYDESVLSITGLKNNAPEWIECYCKATTLSIVESSMSDLGCTVPLRHLTTIIGDRNRIETIGSCGALLHLRTLSLNNNLIEDLQGTLDVCGTMFPRLSYLSLLGNPCCPSPVTGGTQAQYRAYCEAVQAALPQLRFLDSVAVGKTQRGKTIFSPLKCAVRNIRHGQFKEAAQNMATSLVVTSELGQVVTTQVFKDLLTNAKLTLKSYSNAQIEDDKLASLQATFLPKPLEHDAIGQQLRLVRMKRGGLMTEQEYAHLSKMNGVLQQELSDINRSDTMLALERFEANVFPEVYRGSKGESVGDDSFSRGMRENGLAHVDTNNVVKMLRYDDLPPALDLDLSFDLGDYYGDGGGNGDNGGNGGDVGGTEDTENSSLCRGLLSAGLHGGSAGATATVAASGFGGGADSAPELLPILKWSEGTPTLTSVPGTVALAKAASGVTFAGQPAAPSTPPCRHAPAAPAAVEVPLLLRLPQLAEAAAGAVSGAVSGVLNELAIDAIARRVAQTTLDRAMAAAVGPTPATQSQLEMRATNRDESHKSR